jgi:predicted ArsR family transcriptional regulator
LIAYLQREGPCRTADIAAALGVSEMTAFRTLRALLARGLVFRQGKGPSTRYTAAGSEEGRGP